MRGLPSVSRNAASPSGTGLSSTVGSLGSLTTVRKGLWLLLVNSNELLVSFNDLEAKNVAMAMEIKAKAMAIAAFTPRNAAKPTTSSAMIINIGFLKYDLFITKTLFL